MNERFRFCPRCATALVDRDLEGRARPTCPADACGFVQYGNPTPVVAILPTQGDAAILARNADWPTKMFSLITGFLEAGEDPADCARRELAEELGLTARSVSLIGVYPWAPSNQVLLCYHAETEGELRLGEEIAETKAIPIAKLKPWPMGPGPAVRDWLAARRG